MKDCHLPDAVRYKDRASLAGVAEARLRVLMSECAEWVECMEELRDALTTEAGRIEWKVQTRQDRTDVAAAAALLRDEMRARRDALSHVCEIPGQ